MSKKKRVVQVDDVDAESGTTKQPLLGNREEDNYQEIEEQISAS